MCWLCAVVPWWVLACAFGCERLAVSVCVVASVCVRLTQMPCSRRLRCTKVQPPCSTRELSVLGMARPNLLWLLAVILLDIAVTTIAATACGRGCTTGRTPWNIPNKTQHGNPTVPAQLVCFFTRVWPEQLRKGYLIGESSFDLWVAALLRGLFVLAVVLYRSRAARQKVAVAEPLLNAVEPLQLNATRSD